MVRAWKGMAGKIARRHQLLERQFQFPFSNRHLFDCQRRFDAAALAVQEVKTTKHTKYTKSLPFVYLVCFVVIPFSTIPNSTCQRADAF